MKIKLLNSPNYSRNSRPKKSIKFIIIHYTGMQSEIESINRLINKNSKVSCHYLINRKGTIMQMVKENKIAWHAGVSKWKNIKNLNKNSIGIELVNKGHFFGYENYSNLQINSLIKLYLCDNLKKDFKSRSIPLTGERFATVSITISFFRILYFLIKDTCFTLGINFVVSTPLGTKEIFLYLLKNNFCISLF